ncbi:MAG: hypothetical protein LBV26_08630, partial [Bacteroidales bacterium]|nr:hypothetical protein [Bacteroidales bacterium]
MGELTLPANELIPPVCELINLTGNLHLLDFFGKQNLHTLFVIARVHPKVLGHNADMTYLLKINNLRN